MLRPERFRLEKEMIVERKAIRNQSKIDTVVQVGPVRFGHDPFPVIAGPRAVESEEQIMKAAEIVAASGGAILRGGAFKPTSSPYAFPGLGKPALKLLREAGASVGLPTVTKVLEQNDVDLVAEHVDMIHIDPGSMQNFELLKVVGQSGKPVLLERGGSATIDEWLWSAEYILAEDNDQVVMCEAGIRTFEHATTATLDLSSVAVMQEQSHLPVIVAPSGAAGAQGRMRPMALAAQGVGADGVMIEVHPNPVDAKTTESHQLDPEGFAELMDALGVHRIRLNIDMIDRDLVRLLASRHELAMEIGRMKAEKGAPVRVPEREQELLDIIRAEAAVNGLDPDQVETVFNLILEQSRAAQRRERASG